MTWNTFGRRRSPKHPGRLYVEKNGYGENWPRQRARALKRDDYTCQKCGVFGQDKVHVHHKRKIAWFYNSREQTMDYDAANDLDNLITLCIYGCHKVADGHSQMEGFKYLR